MKLPRWMRPPRRYVQNGRVSCLVQGTEVDIDGCASCPRLVAIDQDEVGMYLRCQRPATPEHVPPPTFSI